MSSNEPSNGISPADAQFVFECLRNLDDDRQVNLGQVASSLGYSNVASVGNRLRALRKTYGFENLVGKNTALGAKADGAAAATGNKTVNNKSDSAPKRGRPARVKSGTLPASSSTEVATRLEVNVGGDDEEVKSVKRKREDEPTTDVKLENASEQPQPQPQVKKRGRKPASVTTSSASNSVSTSATTPMAMAMPPPASASIPSTGQMNGSGGLEQQHQLQQQQYEQA